jgi:Zn-dependent oligopeptidase
MDFVEAPSQMLENWVWKAEVLEKLSGHYQDHSKKLPKELLDKMVAAKNVDSGITYLRQNFFATLDLTLHDGPVPDVTQTYARMMQDISLIPMTPGTRPEAGFGHLMGGYDSGYYGYLWSKVFAQDMFSRFEKAGVLDPKTGGDYRREILEPGGGREESLSLRAFLGREPSDEPFLKSIGLETSGKAARQ